MGTQFIYIDRICDNNSIEEGEIRVIQELSVMAGICLLYFTRQLTVQPQVSVPAQTEPQHQPELRVQGLFRCFQDILCPAHVQGLLDSQLCARAFKPLYDHLNLQIIMTVFLVFSWLYREVFSHLYPTIPVDIL